MNILYEDGIKLLLIAALLLFGSWHAIPGSVPPISLSQDKQKTDICSLSQNQLNWIVSHLAISAHE
ncbi:MAG: hypothetical protein CVV27_05445 [Candidatus Melainabacteria bacterium HGW-Melainabacteria-1]|nr:MAG: hypothetical protein CVV27_05445 [Candidatus Melainabacteria bacterium HGW-Melainabacteria-1]